MSESDPRAGTKTFEAKVANLIAATRHLEIPHILMLRRLTMRDPEARKWASEKQLNVVFSVILTKTIERFGIPKLKAARDRNFEPLLPPDPAGRDEDLRVISDIATQLLGPPQMSEAESAQAGFHALLARGAVAPPQRTIRTQPPTREPPPLFAAQLGPSTDKGLSAARRMAQLQQAAEDNSEKREITFTDFPTLFDDTIFTYVEKTLSIFRITSPSRGMRLPFLLAPEFGQVYREILQKYVLPQMRATRAMQALGQSYNWADVGSDKLIEIIQGSEVNNPILHNWDARWASFRAPKAVKGKKAPAQKPEDNPWPLLREEATRYNYEPPTEGHIILLQDIIRFEADVLGKCWRELNQLYTQEFSPSGRMDQAREGAFRDGIMKWTAKLPDYIGEHLAMKAHFEFDRLDGSWMRKLLNSFGKNVSERRRNAPFLTDFVMQLGA